jgi:hypothetical protein
MRIVSAPDADRVLCGLRALIDVRLSGRENECGLNRDPDDLRHMAGSA